MIRPRWSRIDLIYCSVHFWLSERDIVFGLERAKDFSRAIKEHSITVLGHDISLTAFHPYLGITWFHWLIRINRYYFHISYWLVLIWNRLSLLICSILHWRKPLFKNWLYIVWIHTSSSLQRIAIYICCQANFIRSYTMRLYLQSATLLHAIHLDCKFKYFNFIIRNGCQF